MRPSQIQPNVNDGDPGAGAKLGRSLHLAVLVRCASSPQAHMQLMQRDAGVSEKTQIQQMYDQLVSDFRLRAKELSTQISALAEENRMLKDVNGSLEQRLEGLGVQSEVLPGARACQGSNGVRGLKSGGSQSALSRSAWGETEGREGTKVQHEGPEPLNVQEVLCAGGSGARKWSPACVSQERHKAMFLDRMAIVHFRDSIRRTRQSHTVLRSTAVGMRNSVAQICRSLQLVFRALEDDEAGQSMMQGTSAGPGGGGMGWMALCNRTKKGVHESLGVSLNMRF